MSHCPACGGRLKRIHRTFLERLLYLAVYQCSACKSVSNHPRGFMFYAGSHTRCPRCGTSRLSRLNEPDRIDRMHRTLFQLVRFPFGARLYHCRFCRVQFYDRRPCGQEAPLSDGPVTRTARSDA